MSIRSVGGGEVGGRVLPPNLPLAVSRSLLSEPLAVDCTPTPSSSNHRIGWMVPSSLL